MKKTAIAFMIILMMTAGFFCHAEKAAPELTWIQILDGEDWQDMPEENRTFWIKAFKAKTDPAIRNNDTDGKGNLPIMNRKELEKFTGISLKRVEKKLSALKVSGTAIEELRKDTDRFYQNPENRKIKIIDAFHIISMKRKGEKPELIKAQKNYLRIQPVDAITEATRLLADYKDIEYAKELFLREGFFAKPKTKEPSKKEDYQLTSLFRYGVYQ
jgi:hypothetical protein